MDSGFGSKLNASVTIVAFLSVWRRNGAKNKKSAEKAQLSYIHERMSKEQTEMLLKLEKALDEYQAQTEHQSLDCLPKVSLKDVPPHAKDYPLQNLQYHCFTNGIVYANLFFDLPRITDLPLLSFLSRIATEVGCKGRSYAKMLELQHSCVGDLTSSITLFPQSDPSICRPAFAFRGKALDRHTNALFSLLQDYSTEANFLDIPRTTELLQQHATHLQNRIPKNAMNYAIQAALAAISPTAAIQEQWQGIPYLEFILRATKDPQGLSHSLQELYNNLFGLDHALIITSQTPLTLAMNLPKRNLPAWECPILANPNKALGKIIAAPVAFSALAYPSIPFDHPDSAALMVASDLFENVVLHNEIREKGGAYGAGATYLPNTCHFYFSSYRDPHIARTYQAFHKAIERIASGKFTAQELEEAKLGVLQGLDAPVPPGQRAATAYSWQRTGRTFPLRDLYRQAVINATKEQITQAVTKHLLQRKAESAFVTFAGEELLRKESKKLGFDLVIEAI